VTALLIDALANRYSARSFDARPVERAVLDALVEAFRWAPSSGNRQPWRLLIATDEGSRAAFDRALTESNQAWAPRAPLKIVVLGHPQEQLADFAQERWLLDCGLALGCLLVQARAMGLNVRAMAGFDEQAVLSGFGIPEPFRAVALVACGYPGRLEDLPPAVQEKERRPRARRATDEILSWNRFGGPDPDGAA